jgi:hypothetical protein
MGYWTSSYYQMRGVLRKQGFDSAQGLFEMGVGVPKA